MHSMQMCCIHGICILAPCANVSARANMIFHPVAKFIYLGSQTVKTINFKNGPPQFEI